MVPNMKQFQVLDCQLCQLGKYIGHHFLNKLINHFGKIIKIFKSDYPKENFYILPFCLTHQSMFMI